MYHDSSRVGLLNMANCCQVLGGSEVSGNPFDLIPIMPTFVNAHQQD